MVARRCCLLVTLVAVSGCGGLRLPRPGGPAPTVMAPATALPEARRLDDPIAAADVAWVAANDRGLARTKLDAAFAAEPSDPRPTLRRAMLSLTDLDLSGAQADLTRTVQLDPKSAEAGAALVILHNWKSEMTAESSTLAAGLLASGLVVPGRPAEPFHRALATAVLMRLSGAPKPPTLRQIGGWLPTARVVGPLGPRHERLLTAPAPLEDAVDWSNRTPFRGIVPPIRVVDATGIHLPLTAGRRAGTYLMQAFFRVAADREVLLQARLPSYARLKIDGFTAMERDPAVIRPPGLMARRLRLERGWHRITALVSAGSKDTLAISLLDEEGQPVALDVRPTPPASPLTVGSPKFGDTGVAAFGEGHPYWLAAPADVAPEQVLFRRLLAAATALSFWLDDLETARAYLYGLDKAAPDSAAVRATLARLASWARYPDNLVQIHLREALARDPHHAAVLVGLGRRTLEQNPTQALELAERAIAVAPDAFAPHALAYEAYRSKDWNAEAALALKRAAKRGAPPRILLSGSRYLRNIGQIKAADALETLAMRRSGPNRRSLLARRALRRGAVDKALRIARKDHRKEDELRRTEWALAAGEADEALRSAQAILEKDPLSARARRWLALAHASKGELDAARAALGILRTQGQTSPTQEALAASWGGPAVDAAQEDSWLGRSMVFAPLPYVAPLPGTERPRGLDASDRWAGHGQVQILDRLIDRVMPDGSSISVRHGVTRLQTKEATDRAGEINLPPDALALALRTLKPDGSTVDVDRHPGKEDLSFSALAPGDAIERKWVTIEPPASPWGGYVRRFFLKSTAPIVRSEFAVMVPKPLKAKFFLYHGAPQPTIHEDGDQVIYYWRADDVTPLVPEPNSPHPTEYVPFVVMTVNFDRDTALEARSQRLRHYTRRSYDVEQTARAIVHNAPTKEARVQAIFQWLVKNTAKGRATLPSQVLARGRGNRTGLFATMLNAAGIPAEVVRARTGSAPVVAPSYPNLDDFQRTLVRIDLDGRTMWADMSGASPWLGRLSPWYQGGHYLTRSAEGRPVVRPVLDKDIATWPIQSQLRLRVMPNGDASGTIRLELTGNYGAELARALASTRTDQQQRWVQQWLVSTMPSAQLQRLDIQARPSPLAPFVLTASVAVPGFMAADRGHLVSERFFSAPLVGATLGQPELRGYLRLARRSSPLVVSPVLERSMIVVDFPTEVGDPVEGPRSFSRTASFGRIEQQFNWDAEKKQARLERLRAMPLSRIAPADFSAFRDNAQEVLQASRNRLILPLTGPVKTAAVATRDYR